MKHPLKTLLSLVTLTLTLILFLGLALTACTGGGDTEKTEPASPADTQSDVSTEPDTETPTNPAGDTTGDAVSETSTEPVSELEAPAAQFAVLSDAHIGKTNVTPLPEDKLASALEQIAALMPDCQAVAFAGDMTDRGMNAEYKAFMDIWNQNKPANAVMSACLGNHEFFRDGVVRYGGESEAFLKQCRDAYERYVGELHTDIKIGGVHIIAISCDNSAARYAGAEQFLLEHVKAAAEEDPHMPIVVITHQGFGTYYNSGAGAFSAATTRALQEYPQLVVFSGHTHYSAYDPRMIQQNHYTTIQTGTVGADYWSYSYIDPDQPPYKDETSEGYLVSVSKAGLVTVTRYDFLRQCEIAEPWVIDIPAVCASTKAFTYQDARAAAATEPAFPADASVQADNITPKTVDIRWPLPAVGSDARDGAVIHYDIKAVERKSGAVFAETTVLSEYFLGAQAASSVSHTLVGLIPNATYDVTVTAETSWGKTATVSGTFTTLPDESAPGGEEASVLLSVDYTSGSYEDKGDNALKCELFGNPKIENGVAVLNKESAYAYHLTDAIYSRIPAGLSLEAEIYIDPDQTFPWGYVTVIGNTESGGFALTYYDNGVLQFEINIGGTYKTLEITPKTGEWFHILATYDGTTQNMYVDGILAASAACSGNIQHVAPVSRKLVVGADVNKEGGIQCISNILVRTVTLYDKGLSAETAFEHRHKGDN